MNFTVVHSKNEPAPKVMHLSASIMQKYKNLIVTQNFPHYGACSLNNFYEISSP